MAKRSAIEWTDATWNPWMGCTKVSSGCKHCYAERDMKVYGRDFNTVTRSKTTFEDPLKWREAQRVFVCSWSDFLHPDADEWRDEAFDVMRRAPQHTYLVLTKRIERAASYWWGPVWLGVTAEDQEQADKRIPQLLEVPAAVRFVSCEPLLGPIDLRQWLFEPTGRFRTYKGRRQLQLRVTPRFNWVIVGGESGSRARPMDIEWARYLVEQCQRACVPVFVKQLSQNGGRGFKDFASFPPELQVREIPA